MISVTLTNESADGMIADLQRIFPSLLAGAGLPLMVEQPKREEPAPAEPAKRGRKKAEDAKADANPTSATETSGVEAATEAVSTSAEVPDIELVRAKLKQMGATDGLGHDKVFEVLGKYKATNASSVPTEKRASLIFEIDGLLVGAAK